MCRLIIRKAGAGSGSRRDSGIAYGALVDLAVAIFVYDPITGNTALVATIGTEEDCLSMQYRFGWRGLVGGHGS